MASVFVFRSLAVAHALVGLLLLPLVPAFGLLMAPALAIGPLWLVVLGYRLWRPGPAAVGQLRRTHLVSAPVAALLVALGVFALEAARRSAAAGGGLLGAYGLVPLGLGLLLGALAAVSLLVARRPGRGPAGTA